MFIFDKTFLIGVLSGTIGSIIAVWILFLLSRWLKPVWIRLTNAPLNLEAKVRLARQLEEQQKLLEKLNHMEANPKDLFLYLFQLGIVIFLSAFSSMFLFLFSPVSYPICIMFLLFACLFSVLAIIEANRMSAKNIGETKTKVQNNISEAISKLGLPPSILSRPPRRRGD